MINEMIEPLSWEKEHFVSIWIGNFPSRDFFDDFFEEYISDDHEAGSPINVFSADIGIGFYDHDFQEAEFFEESLPVEKLLEQFSYADSFIEEVKNKLKTEKIGNVNVVILLYDSDFRDLPITNKLITFIGSFPYQHD